MQPATTPFATLTRLPLPLPCAVILYVLGFSSRGFTWVHGALFAAMISSTDALAATAILKQGGRCWGGAEQVLGRAPNGE